MASSTTKAHPYVLAAVGCTSSASRTLTIDENSPSPSSMVVPYLLVMNEAAASAIASILVTSASPAHHNHLQLTGSQDEGQSDVTHLHSWLCQHQGRLPPFIHDKMTVQTGRTLRLDY